MALLDFFTLHIGNFLFGLIFILLFSTCLFFVLHKEYDNFSLQIVAIGYLLLFMSFFMRTEYVMPILNTLSEPLLVCAHIVLMSGLLRCIFVSTQFVNRYTVIGTCVLSSFIIYGALYFSPDAYYPFIISNSLQLLLMMTISVSFAIRFSNRKQIELLVISIVHLLYAIAIMIRIRMLLFHTIDGALYFDPSISYLIHITTVFEFTRGLAIHLYATRLFKRDMINVSTQLQQLTYTDPLTGLHNVRSVMRILNKEKDRILKNKTKCCIAIIDLDHFKNVNDTHGHLYGDHVLKTFAKICLSQVRNIDTVARYGGEEFLLVLPETDLYEGLLMTDHLRKSVCEYVWDKPDFHQTICAGVLEINHTNCEDDIRRLINHADEALYVAKKSGRNHVEAANSKLAI